MDVSSRLAALADADASLRAWIDTLEAMQVRKEAIEGRGRVEGPT